MTLYECPDCREDLKSHDNEDGDFLCDSCNLIWGRSYIIKKAAREPLP